MRARRTASSDPQAQGGHRARRTPHENRAPEGTESGAHCSAWQSTLANLESGEGEPLPSLPSWGLLGIAGPPPVRVPTKCQ